MWSLNLVIKIINTAQCRMSYQVQKPLGLFIIYQGGGMPGKHGSTCISQLVNKNCSIHESDERLLYLALCWRSHFYISAGHLFLVINMGIAYQKRCIVCYFYASSKWMNVNPQSRDTVVSLRSHCSNGMDRFVGSAGGHLYFRLNVILEKGLSKHTLSTYFPCMKIDTKYAFLHVFFLIFPSCPFTNLWTWSKTHSFFFSNLAHFCTPKRCMHVHCLVLKNNPNNVILFMRMITTSNTSGPPLWTLSHGENHENCKICEKWAFF